MVNDVSQRLNELLKSADQSTSWNQEVLDGLSRNHLAIELFSRASAEFITQSSTDNLQRICNNSATVLAEFSLKKLPLCIIAKQCDDATELYIALGDRPFIINTCNEVFRDLGLVKLEHLHPIIRVDQQIISLSYIKLNRVSQEEVEHAVKQLSASLHDLIQVTNDFPQMLASNEALIRILGNPKYSTFIPYAEQKELSEFLRWLENGAFIFLAYSKANCNQTTCLLQSGFDLGLLATSNPKLSGLKQLVSSELNQLFESGENYKVLKLNYRSTVHRFSRILAVFVREYAPNGETVAIHCLLGLLTSKALSQEASGTPLIRVKISSIAKQLGIADNTFDFKNIVSLVDCLPKDESLILDIDTLRKLIADLHTDRAKRQSEIAVRADSSRRGTTFLVILPKDKFSATVRQKIQQYLCKVADCSEDNVEYHLSLGEKPEARLYFFLPVELEQLPRPFELEQEISQFCRTWIDEVQDLLKAQSSNKLQSLPKDIFPDTYQSTTTPADALTDLSCIAQLTIENPLAVRGMTNEEDPTRCVIKIFSFDRARSLSSLIPVLENSGLEVLQEEAFRIHPSKESIVYLQRFHARTKTGAQLSNSLFNESINSALEAVILEKSKNDPLNALILQANLRYQNIQLLRCYCEYLWQINKSFARGTLYYALAEEPKLSELLWSIFDRRFNPASGETISQREKATQELVDLFKVALHSVSEISRDKIFRSLLQLILNTVRTNFYIPHPAIAIKLRPELIDFMPNPKPAYEIYVNCRNFEAVHLRTAAVARGGIRWSDRIDDFRHEVLGLMKTQRVKNALIVPNGAKGGFILRNQYSDRSTALQEAKAAYQNFIRCMLSITDNIVNQQIVHPDQVVIYDANDPYLVVAADKGTATFSDLANAVAVNEFNFWLGDAFASGGSNGYDHKKLGITAKGAWECTKRHFKNLGIDYEKESFSCVGIGDLSGDVFGNGLILSKQFKLLAAFNYRHVFIDPNPDPQLSFQERLRIFNLPTSQWSDYDPSLISPGGGVFDRFAKEIKLSEQAVKALGLESQANRTFSGEELIQAILKAPVDLLWNGGIGTYVKASHETDAQINDSTNDSVRVNANELRARVVAEGGNLGFSQQARIEYAKNGGSINTDAIDNSAGVNLSDHEVNIKILLRSIVNAGLLTEDQKDTLLRDLSKSVSESVLQHNREHALTLTVAQRRSCQNIYYFASLIKELTRQKYIDRALEHLPTEDELRDRERRGAGLTRPELAVIFAAVKLQTKDVILNSSLVSEPWLERYLLNYFPSIIREKFHQQLVEHQLRDNLIATEVTNSLIDSLGLSFIHRTCLRNAVTPAAVVRCALVARALLSDPELRVALWDIDAPGQAQQMLAVRQEIVSALQDLTSWLISIFGDRLTLQETLSLFTQDFENFDKLLSTVFSVEQLLPYHERLTHFRNLGFAETLAGKFARLPLVMDYIQISECVRVSSTDHATAARTFFAAKEALQLDSLAQATLSVTTQNRWENELVIKCRDELNLCLLRVVEQLISKKTPLEQVNSAIQSCSSFNQLMILLDDLGATGHTPASLAAVSRQLLNFRIAD